MSIHSVGIVGVGTMGAALCHHILERGFEVTVFDVNNEAVARQTAKGAKRAPSPKEVAEISEMTLVVVASDEQVKDVCLGPNGVLAGASPGHVIAINSTVMPETCKVIADKAGDKCVHVLDTPMLRGELAARDGKLLVLVGGVQKVLEHCRSVFESYATDIRYLGNTGAGQVGKIVNNMILWSTVVSIQEGFSIAKQVGNVDITSLREALKLGSCDSWVLREWERTTQQTRWWDQKDLQEALALAETVDAVAPTAALTKELMKRMGLEQARSLFPSKQ